MNCQGTCFQQTPCIKWTLAYYYTLEKITPLRPKLTMDQKNSDGTFDVTVGLYDGAETCELIGVYMLSLITPKFKDEVGLYCDDGMAVYTTMPREIEKIKQEVSNVFKSNGLKITIKANKKIVSFLDVTSTFQVEAKSHT